MKKIFLALFILYLPFQLKAFHIPLINITNVFLFFLALVWIANKNKLAVRPAFETPLLIFLFIWFLSFLHTIFSPGAGIWGLEIAKLFKRIFTLVLGYFVFARCVNTRKDRQFLFYAFLLGIVLVALYTWKSGVLEGANYGDQKRASGPFGEGWWGSDIAGGFLATFSPFLLAFALLAKKKILRFSALLGVIICAFGIFATYSRGSLIAAGVSFILTTLLAMPYLMKRSKGFGILVLVVMIFAAIGWQRWIPQSVITRIDKTFQVEGDVYGTDSTITFDKGSERRQQIWQMGMDVFYNNPVFGLGFRRPEYELGVDPHNSFILIGAEMGIFGLLAFIWFLWRILMAAKALLKTEYLDLGIGFIGCLTALVIVNCFYSNFFRDTVVGSFWIILGLLAASKSLLSPDRKKEKIPAMRAKKT